MMIDRLNAAPSGRNTVIREPGQGGMATVYLAEDAAAVVGPSEAGGLHFMSGITVYRVTNGEVNVGEFIPLPDSE